jgi:CubicO group peptidase (beta-lactamase class C family)
MKLTQRENGKEIGKRHVRSERRSQSRAGAFRLVGLLCALLAVAASIADAASIDAERLKQIPARMKEFVDRGTISGAIYLVAYQGKVFSLGAVGSSDIENGKSMRDDTIVQIMSQTKSVTGVAVMLLAEEGKIVLTRPVEDYLPEFKGQLVEEKRADGSSFTHAPEHPVTVWQLMAHSGGYLPLPSTGSYTRINYAMDATLEEVVRTFASEHLFAEPGTKYRYSNMGIATLGRIVEVVSGQEFSAFVKSRILDPLGMKDSFFFPQEAHKPRIAMIYEHENGKLVLAREHAQAGDSAKYRAGAKYSGPELAMYSTAADMFRFYQMLANGGELDGHRYLSRQSLAAMTCDQTPDHTGYGLTLAVRNAPGALRDLTSPGTFGHGGAFGTLGWVDPNTGLVVVFLAQMNDGSASPASSALLQIAESAVR